MAENIRKVRKYVKKIIYWFVFIITGVVLYLVIRNQQKSGVGIDTDFSNLHRIDGELKNYLDTAESNVRAATTDNSEALDLVSRFERNNEKFRKLLLDIQKEAEN